MIVLPSQHQQEMEVIQIRQDFLFSHLHEIILNVIINIWRRIILGLIEFQLLTDVSQVSTDQVDVFFVQRRERDRVNVLFCLISNVNIARKDRFRFRNDQTTNVTFVIQLIDVELVFQSLLLKDILEQFYVVQT